MRNYVTFEFDCASPTGLSVVTGACVPVIPLIVELVIGNVLLEIVD